MLGVLVWIGLLGLPGSGEGDDERGGVDSEYAERLGEIALHYRAWGRVDDLSRFAPELCVIPPPATGRISEAKTGEHRRKLYYLYAKHRTAYRNVPTDLREGGEVEVPADQVIVKEAFEPVPCEGNVVPSTELTSLRSPFRTEQEAADGESVDWDAPLVATSEAARLRNKDPESGLYVDGVSTPFAARNGKLYRTGKLRGLYVMAREGDADRTDNGWWYGTILPDGTVTAAGRIESCMRCHEQAGDHRLFGVTEPQLLVNPFNDDYQITKPPNDDD